MCQKLALIASSNTRIKLGGQVILSFDIQHWRVQAKTNHEGKRPQVDKNQILRLVEGSFYLEADLQGAGTKASV